MGTCTRQLVPVLRAVNSSSCSGCVWGAGGLPQEAVRGLRCGLGDGTRGHLAHGGVWRRDAGWLGMSSQGRRQKLLPLGPRVVSEEPGPWGFSSPQALPGVTPVATATLRVCPCGLASFAFMPAPPAAGEARAVVPAPAGGAPGSDLLGGS